MLDAAVFDLGNVLLHFDHRIIGQRLRERFPHTESDELFETRLWSMASRLERGDASAEEFLQYWAALINDAWSTEELSDLWNNIFWVNDAMVKLVRELAGSLRLVLLSNTNALHIDYARTAFPEVFEAFSAQILSYEHGYAKPSPELFEAALRAANCPPGNVLYVDDVLEYVRAGEALGMVAYQYVSVGALKDILQVHEIGLAA